MADQRPMNSPSTDRAAVMADSMLSHFKGGGLLKIALFTIFAHIVILGGSSVPFLMETVLGDDTESMDKETKMENAVREATTELRDIAEKYDLRVQNLSSQFAKGAESKRPKPSQTDEEETEPTEKPADDDAEAKNESEEREKSTIEKQMEVKEDGPAMPSMDEDLLD